MKVKRITTVLLMCLALSSCSILPAAPSVTEPVATAPVTTAATVAASQTTAQTTVVTETTVDPEVVRRQSYETFLSGLYLDLTGQQMPSDSMSYYLDGLMSSSVNIYEIVSSMIESSDFSSEDLQDTDFINDCFNTFMRRAPSDNEMRFYTDLIASGTSRSDIAGMMMASDGFAQVCSDYGLTPEFNNNPELYATAPYQYLAELPDANSMMPIGGYVPSDEVLASLYESMDNLTYKFSFLLVDINTGEGLAYNLDEIYYTASSIKGPFAASFCDLDPEQAANWTNSLISLLQNSDNDAYAALDETYHRTYIRQWCEQLGLDLAPFAYKYPHINSRQMAALWLRSYEFFESGEWGAQVASWYENPNESAIHAMLGDQYVTRSKGGWFVDEDPYRTCTVDAGIVYADNGPYIIVVMSEVPSSMDYLNPIVTSLDLAHQDM